MQPIAIHTDAENEAAVRRIQELWDAEPGSPEFAELDHLASIVDAYEAQRYPTGPASPENPIEVPQKAGLKKKQGVIS